MGLKIPAIPVSTPEERKHFKQLLLADKSPSHPDYEDMAIKWLEAVDGKTIFPKLPVHLRLHWKESYRNLLVKHAVAEAAEAVDKLKQLNAFMKPVSPTAFVPRNETPITSPSAESPLHNQSSSSTNIQTANGAPATALPSTPPAPITTVPVAHHEPLLPPDPQVLQSFRAVHAASNNSLVVDGIRVITNPEDATLASPLMMLPNEKKKARGKDNVKRNVRTDVRCCRVCSIPTCAGRGGKKFCPQYVLPDVNE
jgi:hypothetical protein